MNRTHRCDLESVHCTGKNGAMVKNPECIKFNSYCRWHKIANIVAFRLFTSVQIEFGWSMVIIANELPKFALTTQFDWYADQTWLILIFQYICIVNTVKFPVNYFDWVKKYWCYFFCPFDKNMNSIFLWFVFFSA